MAQDTAVFESESLKRTYLYLFLCGDTVHCGYHGKYRNSKEQNGHDRTHCLAFGRFAHSLFIDHMVILRCDHYSFAKLVLNCLLKRLLVNIRKNIYLAEYLVFSSGNKCLQHIIRKLHILCIGAFYFIPDD